MEYTIPDWDKENYKTISARQEKRYTVTRYELPDILPVAGFNDPIVLDYYKRRDHAPVLIVHPILGGKENKIAVWIAKYFTRFAKWSVVIVHRARVPMLYPTLEGIESGFYNTVTNNLQVFEWLEHHQLIDRQQTACMGVSMGAITTSLLAAVLPLKGFVCVMAGADIADILANTEEPSIEQWRNQQLEKHNMTINEFQERLSQIIKTDPLHIVPDVDPDKARLFIALFDKIVPTSNQRKLRNSFPRRPRTTRLPTGHYTITLVFPLVLFFAHWWLRKKMSRD